MNKICFIINNELYKKAKHYCIDNNISLTKLIINLLSEFLEKE